MAQLENLKRGASVQGILPTSLVTVVDVQWHGSDTITLTYRDAAGITDSELLFHDDEERLEIVTEGQPWSFDADGALLRLASEAQRIRLAHLSDPYLAIHTSEVDPLPHQITAVYEAMLPRQPLRFLLADDPGSGKTIMAGLLIKELMIRGDVQRCLIVCPGNLVEQWQDEMHRRFGLGFAILTREQARSTAPGNIFTDHNLLICRLDQLARNDDLQAKLSQSDWDLVICDEAHKMSATFFGGEVSYTKRHRLGQQLGQITRNLLLMTATPHNGKEEDFQLFMSLLDADRFEGKFRDGVHTVDVSDMIRRMVKEQLLKFDGTPLFPERCAYTVRYKLSDLEARLYARVTDYVREEFNRAEQLENDGHVGTVGFALMILQRRLASSPAAIYRSLVRRRERLESRLREAELLARGKQLERVATLRTDHFSEEEWDDLDDMPSSEREALEEEVMDQATAARSVPQLRIEIDILKELEKLAQEVLHSGVDRKWEELRRLLLDEEAMFDANGRRRKLVIFTEHRDTLDYLTDRIRSLLGRPEEVVVIHGGILHEERRKMQTAFTQDKDVSVLVATDAAGEGINLQRANLMINYDLPWNPNRIEQRFGRIHRIGQTEVCHLWNLVADETREGDVFGRLLEKLEEERRALGGAVFDVLGQAITGRELRQLMIEAIRYGDRPEVRDKLTRTVEGGMDRKRLRELMENDALAQNVMDTSKIRAIRRDMERMEARRLQPHYIASFFLDAFKRLGGTVYERERNRYEITYVPSIIRQRDRLLGTGAPLQTRYERITFEKELRNVQGKPQAEFVCPGHPLLDASVDLILERYRDLMRQGAILVNEQDEGDTLRALFYLEHGIRDGRANADGGRREISRRMQFVKMPLGEEVDDPSSEPQLSDAGMAPYLDYRPLQSEEQSLIEDAVTTALATQDLEKAATDFAIQHLVPAHLREVREQREPLIDKTIAAVKERLTKEITYWDNQLIRLQEQERMGKVNARLNAAMAQRRRDELQMRLRTRLQELALERQIAAKAPVVIGGVLVVPFGLIRRLRGDPEDETTILELRNKAVEMAAMHAAMAAERNLGYDPVPVYRTESYDIVSQSSDNNTPLRMVEVKGYTDGSTDITLTKNEMLHALNKAEDWWLALVHVPKEMTVSETNSGKTLEQMLNNGETHEEMVAACEIRYVPKWFENEPNFGSTGENFNIAQLWSTGTAE